VDKRIRRRSEADADYARLPDAPAPQQIPIFSFGEIAGLSVRLPEPGAVGGARGLLVTDVLPGQWAEQCGARAGARLVALDGKRVENLPADAIRNIADAAARPLWLDIVPASRQAPLSRKALSGAHLLL